MVVGARQAGLSNPETADLLEFSCMTISRVYREWTEKEKISSEQQFCGWKWLVDARGQRRKARLARADRKATVTQITTLYNQGMQKSISELTTYQKQLKLKFARVHQNCTIEDWKKGHLVRWVSISGRVRIWMQDESILHCTSVSGCCWWCNGVGNIFLAHFGILSTN